MHGVLYSLHYVGNSDYIALIYGLGDGSENNVAGHSHGLIEVLSYYTP